MLKFAKASTGEEELLQVKEALDYGYYGLAFKVTQFETEIQKFLNTSKEVISTNNGTGALHLALSALGIGPGDEVIVPSFTFVASVQAITMCGAKPVFCEVYESTLLMDIEDVKKKITAHTKVIMPVHYAGNVCDMDALMKIKSEQGIRIVEDAAHAFGSYYGTQKVGSIGDITCFSFDSIKVITCGEGGAIVTSDAAIAELCRQKRLLGIDRKTMHVKDWKERSWEYDVKVPGFRYHMSNINAAIGLAQIKKIDKFIVHRQELCKQYDELLKGCHSVHTLKVHYESLAPFMYVIKVLGGKRNELKEFLKAKDIETGISYIPCHRFTLYHVDYALPVTDKIYEEILCLPLHFDLTPNDIVNVTEAIKEFFKTDVHGTK